MQNWVKLGTLGTPEMDGTVPVQEKLRKIKREITMLTLQMNKQ